jgi:transposase
MQPIKFKLIPHDKGKLTKIVTKGISNARTINRCRILLLSAEKKSQSFIVEAIGCDPKTILNVKHRYNEAGLNYAIYEKPRSGAPTKFDGKARAKITALACTKAPDGFAKWSLILLADKAVELNIVDSISHTHVGTILKKTR